MALRCNLCSTNCVSCNGGRCRGCNFTTEQVTFSNEIIDTHPVDFAKPGMIEFYKDLISSYPATITTMDEVYKKVDKFKTPKGYVAIVAPVVIPQEQTIQNIRNGCEYDPGHISARDTCKLCGVARFYGQNGECVYKLKS